jgi:5'-nucleotidase
MEKKIVYVDMDGVVADFEKAICEQVPHWHQLSEDEQGALTDEVCGANPGFFEKLEPIKDAINSIHRLMEKYEIYFLSAAMWNVPTSYTDKRIWIENHFGLAFKKRLILTHRKDLNMGDYLIDDRTRHGVDRFKGKHIHFGTETFPHWEAVCAYLMMQPD